MNHIPGAKFTAVGPGGGHHVNLELGQYNEWSFGHRHETTFEVEIYLSGRGLVAITQNKLYVSEMDDDDKATGGS